MLQFQGNFDESIFPSENRQTLFMRGAKTKLIKKVWCFTVTGGEGAGVELSLKMKKSFLGLYTG